MREPGIHTHIRMDTMDIKTTDGLALTRLQQLISPSLPIGGYTYSQGIEWAVEAGWIGSASNLHQWLEGLMHINMHYLELPILKRMLEAWAHNDLRWLEQLNECLR